MPTNDTSPPVPVPPPHEIPVFEEDITGIQGGKRDRKLKGERRGRGGN